LSEGKKVDTNDLNKVFNSTDKINRIFNDILEW